MAELLIDHHSTLRFSLTEAKESGSPNKIIIKGQFARSDKATENKRLYREHLWKREFGRLSEGIKRRRVYGELDHPQDGRTRLQRVSHIITKLEVRGNEVYGEAEVIDTPNGRIMKAIAEASGEVGISSRGFGSVKTLSDGVMEVQEDFRLDTFDFVADPATKTAYPAVFREERGKIWEDEMELTVEALKKDYPGLVGELAREFNGGGAGLTEGATGSDVARAIIEAEERTRDRLVDRFSGEMRRAMEVMREEVEAKVRSDYMTDPEIAGAKQVVEAIASLVMPFGVDAQAKGQLGAKDEEIERLRTELADRELEIQKVTREATESAKMAKEAAYGLHLERKLGADPSKAAILALIGDLNEYDSRTDLDTKVDTVREELNRLGGSSDEEAQTEWEERFAGMERRLQESEERERLAHQQAAEHEQQAQQAIRIAERERVARVVAEETRGMDDDDIATVEGLCEDLTDEDATRKAIADHKRLALVEVVEPRRIMDDDEADRIRARVGRGKERDLHEDTHGGTGTQPKSDEAGVGPLAEFGMGVSDYSRLAGTGKPS